jgi:hypothetical protein
VLGEPTAVRDSSSRRSATRCSTPPVRACRAVPFTPDRVLAALAGAARKA